MTGVHLLPQACARSFRPPQSEGGGEGASRSAHNSYLLVGIAPREVGGAPARCEF